MTKLSRNVAAFAVSAALAVTGVAGALSWKSVSAFAEGETPSQEVDPIAKYLFDDAANPGKDSMGNYHLEIGAGNGGTVAEGAVTFDSSNALKENATTRPLTSALATSKAFTLAFEYKVNEGNGAWSAPLGFGDKGGTNYFSFPLESGSILHFADSKTGNGAELYGYNIATNVNNGAFHKVIISVNPGGKLYAYHDGALVNSTGAYPWDGIADCPANWSLNTTDNLFAIGVLQFGGAGTMDYGFKGSLKNVRIYDFAMNKHCMTQYSLNGKLTQEDLDYATLSVKSVGAPVFADGATSETLHNGMTLAQMKEKLNAATAVMTLVNNKNEEQTETANVVWSEVKKEADKYVAHGTVTVTKEVDGETETFTEKVSYVLTVENIQIGEPVFTGEKTTSAVIDSMTESERLALVNKAKVTLTFPGGSTEEFEVTFTRGVTAGGKYYVLGDVTYNGILIGEARTEIPLTEDTSPAYREIKPIAKYEFKDAANPGKDSMGNYDLNAVVKASDMEGGHATGQPAGKGEVKDGKWYADGDDILALPCESDIGEHITKGFTMSFRYQQTAVRAKGWSTPISFGRSTWQNAQWYCGFQTDPGYADLRFVGSGINVPKGDNSGELAACGEFYGPIVLNNGTSAAQAPEYEITLTVRPGDKIEIYLNRQIAPGEFVYEGKKEFSYPCPDKFTTASETATFAIGGWAIKGADGYDGVGLFTGWISDVSVYNFAMNKAQITSLWEKGKVTAKDMNGEIVTTVSDEVTFANDTLLSGSQKLTDNITATQALKRVNSATVKATFEDGVKNTDILVTWKDYVREGDKWYLVGSVDASDIGYATELTESKQIKYEVTSEVGRVKRPVETDSKVKNGTVSVDKTEAYYGDVIVITLTPKEGYVADTVTVEENGKESTPVKNEDGTYSYTVSSIGGITVTATFKEAAAQQPSGEENKGGCHGSIAGGAAAGGAALLAGVAVAAFVLPKKNKEKRG